MSVSNSNLITLDASLSFNPNEPIDGQNQDIYYIWRCNVTADHVNCKEYTTTSKKNYIIAIKISVYIEFTANVSRQKIILDPKRQLTGFLDKAKIYEFSLTTRVSDSYAKRVGKPIDGTAKIILFSNAITLGLRIE